MVEVSDERVGPVPELGLEHLQEFVVRLRGDPRFLADPVGIVSVPAPASPPSGLVFVIEVSKPQGNPIQFALSVDKLRQILTNQSGGPSPTPTSPFG